MSLGLVVVAVGLAARLRQVVKDLPCFSVRLRVPVVDYEHGLLAVPLALRAMIPCSLINMITRNEKMPAG